MFSIMLGLPFHHPDMLSNMWTPASIRQGPPDIGSHPMGLLGPVGEHQPRECTKSGNLCVGHKKARIRNGTTE